MTPSVAIIHDYLTQKGGAERVLRSMMDALPAARVLTSVYDPLSTFPDIGNDRTIETLWMNRLPALRQHHRLNFPFLAPSFASTRIEEDVALCSSSGWAHGVRATGRKIVYCYTPARWLYQPNRYLGSASGSFPRAALRVSRPSLRKWDWKAAQTADAYVAISRVVRDRIRALYDRDALVLHPPLRPKYEGEPQPIEGLTPGYWLCVSRLLPYKNVDSVIAAFKGLRTEFLVVVGDGPDRSRLQALAPNNVRFVGGVTDSQLAWLYVNCRGLLAASYEDFGLTPLEANSYGKPVGVLAWGGFLDTVREGENGVFFEIPEPTNIARAITEILTSAWKPSAIRAVAAEFGEKRFHEGLLKIVNT